MYGTALADMFAGWNLFHTALTHDLVSENTKILDQYDLDRDLSAA